MGFNSGFKGLIGDIVYLARSLENLIKKHPLPTTWATVISRSNHALH